MIRPFKGLQAIMPKMAELFSRPDSSDAWPPQPPTSHNPLRSLSCLLLIADTHVPRRARDLPAAVWDEVADADVVLHAGDWVEPSLLDDLEEQGRAGCRVLGQQRR